jgi:nucleoside-diphosphate-sugar epimerase
MKIAITGGTGFVGRALARRLGAAGHDTIVVSRRTGHALDLSHVDRLAAMFRGMRGDRPLRRDQP